MKTLEQKYSDYRNELRKLQEQRDAWYTIASQKHSEGDKAGQTQAYAELEKIEQKIMALVNPYEENDQILGEGEGLL